MPASSLIPALIGGALGVGGGDSLQTPLNDPSAIVRVLPKETAKGLLTPPLTNLAQIDGKILPLSPGLQVRNEKNLIVMPGTLQQPVAVRYENDQNGAVIRIWILSAQEAAAP